MARPWRRAGQSRVDAPRLFSDHGRWCATAAVSLENACTRSHKHTHARTLDHSAVTTSAFMYANLPGGIVNCVHPNKKWMEFEELDVPAALKEKVLGTCWPWGGHCGVAHRISPRPPPWAASRRRLLAGQDRRRCRLLLCGTLCGEKKEELQHAMLHAC